MVDCSDVCGAATVEMGENESVGKTTQSPKPRR